MYQKAFRCTFDIFVWGWGNLMMTSEFLLRLFKKFSSAWVFCGGLVEGGDPGSMCGKVTDLQRAAV